MESRYEFVLESYTCHEFEQLAGSQPGGEISGVSLVATNVIVSSEPIPLSLGRLSLERRKIAVPSHSQPWRQNRRRPRIER